MTRKVCEVANDIRKYWPKISPHAQPYLEAMLSLESVNQNYYADSGTSIVAYFLANAQGFRGEHAKALKKELNDMLKGK